MLNTIVAEQLDQFANKLEKAGADKFTDALNALIKKSLKEHERIIFNGNGYSINRFNADKKYRRFYIFKAVECLHCKISKH